MEDEPQALLQGMIDLDAERRTNDAPALRSMYAAESRRHRRLVEGLGVRWAVSRAATPRAAKAPRSPQRSYLRKALMEAGRLEELSNSVIPAELSRRENQPHPSAVLGATVIAYLNDYCRARNHLVHECLGLSALAEAGGFHESKLRKTLTESGLEAPYVCLGPIQSSLTVTEGGLAVGTALRILDSQGSPTLGLFAVGAVGLLLIGHGLHIGCATTSGRVGETLSFDAGRNAA